ncbi:TRAP transporter small permease [Rhodobium gokarnense]|uniref:TRAP transporter small permease protein n=1 Tax=Rhodobium gokarnense TaxID=364296 RepID=A0ABT3HFA5_9HYPH|nr:TRAP transporter small permease [Rhodobium gokarnense]MCW2309081.1 TRAP-type C4-dicarboxylate transport system permease small subunit [Rhodobium gokarnense]
MSHDDKGEGAQDAPSLPKGFLTWPGRLGGIVASALVLAVLALVVYAILQRYFLDTPLKWGDELSGYLLVALVMLGAAETLRHGEHIAIDLVTGKVGPTLKRLLAVIANLAVIGFAVVLGLSAWESISFAYDFGSYSPGYLEVATWIPQLPMLIGAGLLILLALALLIRHIAGKDAA